MEIIRGKQTSFMDSSALAERLAGYTHIHIDLGTGDGRYVRTLAGAQPQHFVVGIDACRENLHEASRSATANALFVIANAQALPSELYGLAESLTINFPWGSLLDGLLADDPALLLGLAAVTRPGAALDVRLNAGALAESRWSAEDGARRVQQVLAENGFSMRSPVPLSAADLRKLPTSWAKRLAFGRYPYALHLRGTRQLVGETILVKQTVAN